MIPIQDPSISAGKAVRKLKKIITVGIHNFFINNDWNNKRKEVKQNQLSLNEITQLEKGGWVAGERYDNGLCHKYS